MKRVVKAVAALTAMPAGAPAVAAWGEVRHLCKAADFRQARGREET